MENKFSDQPAFPVTEETTDRIEDGVRICTGLTKRECFAAMAILGMPVEQADALIKALTITE